MKTTPETPPPESLGSPSGSVVLGKCPRSEWYQEKGRSLRRTGWRLRRNGPKWDAENALIERAAPGTAEWRRHALELLATLEEQIQKHVELGTDAANEGDRQNAWYADKAIAKLKQWKAETEETLAKHPPND